MGRSIVPNLADHEVWFLTGSQTMYGDEVLAQVASQSQQVVEMAGLDPDMNHCAPARRGLRCGGLLAKVDVPADDLHQLCRPRALCSYHVSG